MKLDVTQDAGLGLISIHMQENCHADSAPLVSSVNFYGVHTWVTPDTSAVAAAIAAARWTGDMLTVASEIGTDAAQSVRMITGAEFVMPIDGYRRNLCEGHMDVLVAPAAKAGRVLSVERSPRTLARLVTWSGDSVDPVTRSSVAQVAGEVSTNAALLLPEWEVSVCLGLLVGGPRLRSIVVPRPETRACEDFDRLAVALRLIGVDLRPAEPAPRHEQESLSAPRRRKTSASTRSHNAETELAAIT